jgi:hypothetical protein
MSHGSTERQRLERIAETLLCAETSPRELSQAAFDLHDCLSSPVRDVVRLEDVAVPATSLPDGIAISPVAAAACLKDPVRTVVFLRGVDAALTESLRRFPGETIDVVYAGTGPLAPLVLPLLPRFADAPLRFTLVDVHPDSVAATRIVAAHFGVTSAIDAFVIGDATRYEHPRGRRLHGLVSETMQAALAREPQVAITRQIAPQVVPGGFIVPESVRIDLLLADAEAWGHESRDEREVDDLAFVQTLFELRSGVQLLPLDSERCLPPVRVRLPSDPSLSKRIALYGTSIVTFGDHAIALGQSGLTLPLVAEELMPLQPGTEWELRYQVGPSPRFLATKLRC